MKTKNMNILDSYVMKEPSNQNIFDIFKGEWSSKIPDQFQIVTQPGAVGLFEDGRIEWAEQVFGNLAGLNILELGPLEGGHSYMMQKKNAKKITAIEANTRSFLKCLCVKEVLKLDKVEFLFGDFVPFLKNQNLPSKEKFDIIFASGVLYHMEDPIELLKLISEVSDRIFLWTHYYDKETLSNNKALRGKFKTTKTNTFESFSYEYSIQSYNEALGWAGFCGGAKQTSKWLTRDSIIGGLKHFGYDDIQVGFDEILHQNGPAFAICGTKSKK